MACLVIPGSQRAGANSPSLQPITAPPRFEYDAEPRTSSDRQGMPKLQREGGTGRGTRKPSARRCVSSFVMAQTNKQPRREHVVLDHGLSSYLGHAHQAFVSASSTGLEISVGREPWIPFKDGWRKGESEPPPGPWSVPVSRSCEQRRPDDGHMVEPNRRVFLGPDANLHRARRFPPGFCSCSWWKQGTAEVRACGWHCAGGEVPRRALPPLARVGASARPRPGRRL